MINRNGEARPSSLPCVFAWACYLPLPFLRLALSWFRPDDRLMRYHAVQGRIITYGSAVLLTMIGFLGQASNAPGYQASIGGLALPVLMYWVGAAAIGAIGAVRGRFTRVEPAHWIARWLATQPWARLTA